MDIEDDLSCLCGKRFLRSSAAANHRKSCLKTKFRVSSLLENAKQVWLAKKTKRRRLEESEESSTRPSVSDSHVHPETVSHSGAACGLVSKNNVASSKGEDANSNLSLAARRTPRLCRSPARHADYVRYPESPSPSLKEANLGLEVRPSLVDLDSDRMSVDDSHEMSGSETIVTDPIDEGNVENTASSPDPLEPSTLSLNTYPNRFHLFKRFLFPMTLRQDPCPGEQGFEDLTEFYASNASLTSMNENRKQVNNECLKVESPSEESRKNIPDNHPSESLPLQQGSRSIDSVKFDPYPNLSSFLLGEWFWNGGTQKSQKDFDNLMRILRSHTFNIDDIQTTKWSSINRSLGELDEGNIGTTSDHENIHRGGSTTQPGWKSREIQIQVPFHKHQLPKETVPGPKPYVLGEFCYRSIVSIIKERLSGHGGRGFHFDPYETYWSPAGKAPQRVYGELYTSPAFCDAHKEIQSIKLDANSNMPRVVVALMFSSDETHLAQFGDTKLWPLYMAFGNESKYQRCMPTEHASHHVAYFSKLPDAFREFVSSNIGAKKVNPDLITHCIREALHVQWEIILDDEFIDAYKNGIVILCFDGILRLFFPRIFTYSADYKEKVLLAGIRSIPAKCPCPRCLTLLKNFPDLGTLEDRDSRQNQARTIDDEYRRLMKEAQKNLYEENYAVDGKKVDGVLKEASLAPAKNAFFSKLADHGFDFFASFVVDLMHEVESGNWKSLFIHLIRILHCDEDKSVVHKVDSRYRQTPTFGGGTIRKFQRNMTDMRNLAARDWEDMLQCAIPVFDGLFEEPHNSIIIDLLYVLAHWHGLAKLRLHTDETLDLLDQVTSRLGDAFRHFKLHTCSAFKTQELPKEVNARYRRKTKKAMATAGQSQNAAEGGKACSQAAPKQPQAEGTAEESDRSKVAAVVQRNAKEFNLRTYKFHAFGDYVSTIKRLGTTDSYSTESGELEHRSSKNRYKRTSKKNFTTQMAQIERRQTRIRKIRSGLDQASCAGLALAGAGLSSSSEEPSEYIRIAKSESSYLYLFDFLNQNRGDPAVQDADPHLYKNFLQDLKAHLLPRARVLFKVNENDQDSTIIFEKDRMFKHQTLRISYDTYDLRKGEDVINPDSPHRDIMLLKGSIYERRGYTAAAVSHPFVYARVLGIYHVNVIYPHNSPPRRMDFLWVRWYIHEPSSQENRLDKLRFPAPEDENGFGFVDPSDAIRACHVVPDFNRGKPGDGILSYPSEVFWYPKQQVRLETRPLKRKDPKQANVSKFAQDRDDWNAYYLNPFVDRDMLMRYCWGMSVGHTYCQKSSLVHLSLGRVPTTVMSGNGTLEKQDVAGVSPHSQKEVGSPLGDEERDLDVSTDSEPDLVLKNGYYELLDPEAEDIDYMEDLELDEHGVREADQTEAMREVEDSDTDEFGSDSEIYESDGE